MSQVFGYLCSDDSLTGELMSQFGGPLEAIAPEDRAGMGIGWLQDGRSLLRKHPRRKAATVELRSVLADVPTRALVGYVRHLEEEKAGTEDLQPFRFRNFVYAQVGGAKRIEEVFGDWKNVLPDHVSRNIKGKTAEEVFFHHFFAKVESRLSITAKSEWPEMYATMMARSLGELPQLEVACLAVTDRALVAATTGPRLWYRRVEGLEMDSEKPLFAGHKPKKIQHHRYRALLVTAGVAVEEEGWQEIEPGTVLWADGEWRVGTLAIPSEASEE